MGTIVYGNLVELLLEEGDKSEAEIVNEAVNRFGFERENVDGKIMVALALMKRYNIEELPDGKYHLKFVNDSEIIGRGAFLNLLNKTSEKYLAPHILKLKKALEESIKCH